MKRKIGLRRPVIEALIGCGVMLCVTAGLLYGGMRWHSETYGRYLSPQEISWKTVQKEAIPLPKYAEDYGVRAVYRGLDTDGEIVSYIVESAAEGYHAGSEIVIESEIDRAGELIARMTVLSQHEDKYYGDRIALPSFAQRFEGRVLPLLLPEENGKGSRIDSVSGATGSSAAVLRAVNAAYEFLQRMLTE